MLAIKVSAVVLFRISSDVNLLTENLMAPVGYPIILNGSISGRWRVAMCGKSMQSRTL
jgi:hypothetical protein